MHLTFNNEIVGGLNEGGIIDFNLFEVAKVLGYARPSDAIRNFTQRSKVFIAIAATCRIDLRKCDERVVYAFLMYSDMPRAVDFQIHLATEILPLVRQVGVRAIQELAVMNALKLNYRATLEELYEVAPSDVVDDILHRENRYTQFGFYPPSHFGTPKKIAEALNQYGVFDAEGNPLPEYSALVRFSDKYIGYHAGKWYAYKPELVEKVLTQMKLEPSKPVWFENIFINDLELR